MSARNARVRDPGPRLVTGLAPTHVEAPQKHIKRDERRETHLQEARGWLEPGDGRHRVANADETCGTCHGPVIRRHCRCLCLRQQLRNQRVLGVRGKHRQESAWNTA